MRRMFSLKQLQEIADNRVKALVEGGTLENAKPLYFHPIRFSISGSSGGQSVKVVYGSIMIINNDSTALDTSPKLREYLRDNTIDILCNVDFYDADGLYQGQILQVSGSTNFVCLYTKDGATTTSLYLADTEFVVSADGVNKIN